MIVKSVILRCSPERAFALFTERGGDWWPAGRRHTSDMSSTIRIEAGGRFFERARDGTEVELGVVRAFEPAKRLVLDWYPGTGRENPTNVEVVFEIDEAGTRITIKHGPGKAGAARFEQNARAYAASWDFVLAALAATETGAD